MTTHHRYRMFRRMVNSMDKVPFSLAAWELKLTHDDSFKKWWNIPGIKGMSVAAISDWEHSQIVDYCTAQGAIHISKKRKFEDFLHNSYVHQVMNLPDDLIDCTYVENEVCVIGTDAMIDSAIEWVRQLPPRLHVCYAQGIPLREIKKYLKDTNVRIVPNTSDFNGYFISTDNKDALFPLWLQG